MVHARPLCQRFCFQLFSSYFQLSYLQPEVTSIRLTEPVKEFPQSWHVSVSFFFIGYEFLLKKHLLYYMYANSLKKKLVKFINWE